MIAFLYQRSSIATLIARLKPSRYEASSSLRAPKSDKQQDRALCPRSCIRGWSGFIPRSALRIPGSEHIPQTDLAVSPRVVLADHPSEVRVRRIDGRESGGRRRACDVVPVGTID